MTTDTLTLTDFLLARIAEDEEVAHAAVCDVGMRWRSEDGMLLGQRKVLSNDIYFDGTAMWECEGSGSMVPPSSVATHAARHDPARVLAECEAKRRIVEWCGEREMIWVGTVADDPLDPKPEQFVPGPLRNPADAVVLRLLASVYADHPDYREEWRVDG